MERFAIEVRGIVQGVGFRPFAARKARELGLGGNVCNTYYGALIECEGETEKCEELYEAIIKSPPSGAVIFSAKKESIPPKGETSFKIMSSGDGAPDAAVSPDLGVCDECERELFDPNDRRYRYPFLNCTACGPRFTILEKVPYDRASTTMKKFPMCTDCAGEYNDPEDRRFHAQPTACPECGPRLMWIEDGNEKKADPIKLFEEAIRRGKLIAVKGLGGFHLACDAENETAVEMVRTVKHRYEKPLAIMVRSIGEAERLCHISDAEKKELLSPRKPIVLLEKRRRCNIAESVSPDNDRLGIMLPYTPLHLLITENLPPLVMTSCNISDDPMPYRQEDMERASALCDGMLTHDRPILRRMDDSVTIFTGETRHIIRRARGFAPQPVPIRTETGEGQVLAFGSQLKNSFCLMKNKMGYISGHVGDLDNGETEDFYEEEIPRFMKLFGAMPDAFACDMHPDYVSTRTAERYGKLYPNTQIIRIQHHKAHFASVLAEHGIDEAVGFVFDGAGRGEDGLIWGGEMFAGSAGSPRRIGRMRPIKLIGGDAAVKNVWRIGLAAAADAVGKEKALEIFREQDTAQTLMRIYDRKAFSPESSGFGRLFDAVAAITGIKEAVSYEGQAAVMLEQRCCENAPGEYGFEIEKNEQGLFEFDWRPVILSIIKDTESGTAAGVIATRFHRAVVSLIKKAAGLIPEYPLAFSGGVFQNTYLVRETEKAFPDRKTYFNELVPTNDGGISYGQCAAAGMKMR